MKGLLDGTGRRPADVLPRRRSLHFITNQIAQAASPPTIAENAK
jgi:hypothetical protein